MRCEAAIHATAVAIGANALLIVGPSRSGKSTLAAALMASTSRDGRVELVGDDRVLLDIQRGGKIIARPHPRIAGFIERRGLGLVAVAHRPYAPVSGIVDLAATTTRRLAWLDRPVLKLAQAEDSHRRIDLVRQWIADLMWRGTWITPDQESSVDQTDGSNHYSW